MIITDTFSNLFSNIKNSLLAEKSKTLQLNSKQVINLLNVFIREGFIKSYKILPNKKKLAIYLKYKNENKQILLKRVSRPGKRLYLKNKDLYIKKKGIYILSTSKGMLTDSEAKKLNIGGELIRKIL